MKTRIQGWRRRIGSWAVGAVTCLLASPAGNAAEDVFTRGAESLVDFALTIATPLAIITVIGVGLAAAVGRISWGWVVGVVVGIGLIFGAPQLVPWARDLFGV